jgi:hypothetical protein
VNLKSHHGRLNVVRGFRNRLIGLNSPGQLFDYPPILVAVKRIADAATLSRMTVSKTPVDRMRAVRMAVELWRCDD